MKQNISLFSLPLGFRGRSALTVQLWWFGSSHCFCLVATVCVWVSGMAVKTFWSRCRDKFCYSP